MMVTPKRRGPSSGYDFAEKQEYRNIVWDIFAENVYDVSTANVVFMPSKEGLEIPVAIARGFREENLIAVDDNAAMIAASAWRKKYPQVKFYGNRLSRASERISNDGLVISAANLDLCGNLSWPMLKETKQFIENIRVYGDPTIAITMLKGRDSTAVNTLADMILSGDNFEFDKRIHVLMEYVSDNRRSNYPIPLGGGEYHSGKQKMCYGVFKVYMRYFLNIKAKEYADYLDTFSKKLAAMERGADILREELISEFPRWNAKRRKRFSSKKLKAIRKAIYVLCDKIKEERERCELEVEKYPYPIHKGLIFSYAFRKRMEWYLRGRRGGGDL